MRVKRCAVYAKLLLILLPKKRRENIWKHLREIFESFRLKRSNSGSNLISHVFNNLWNDVQLGINHDHNTSHRVCLTSSGKQAVFSITESYKNICAWGGNLPSHQFTGVRETGFDVALKLCLLSSQNTSTKLNLDLRGLTLFCGALTVKFSSLSCAHSRKIRHINTLFCIASFSDWCAVMNPSTQTQPRCWFRLSGSWICDFLLLKTNKCTM